MRLYDCREEELPMRRLFILSVAVLALSACASSPRVQRSEFEDIPVPKGLTVDMDKSTIIESPAVKAARIFYKGRLEPESLATAFRTTLEANGWRHLSSTMASGKGVHCATRLGSLHRSAAGGPLTVPLVVAPDTTMRK